MKPSAITISKTVPRLKLLEGIRTLKQFALDPLGSLSALAERGEPLQRFRGIDLSILMLHDPELIGEVLMNREDHFIKDRFTADLQILLGLGLLTSEGELWKHQRRLIAPSLSAKHIAEYGACMVRRTEEFVQEFVQDFSRGRPNRDVDMHTALMQLTLDIVVETLFGAELDERDGRVGEMIEHIMEDYVLLVRTWRRMLPRWIPQPVLGRIRRISASIDEMIARIVATKRAGTLDGGDLLTRLLVAQAGETTGGTTTHPLAPDQHRQLRDELVTLFTAGHETTALTLAFALYLIADRPEVQERLREEIARTAGGRPLAATDTMQGGLPYTTAVIRESMRLYPPAWIIGRQTVRDCQVSGYALKRGEQILIAPYSLHRDPRYFPEPDEFRPERWENGLHESLPRYVYLPFGGGPRICVGNHFAMMEAVLVLGTIVRSARFARPANAPALKFFPAITLRPAVPLALTVTPDVAGN